MVGQMIGQMIDQIVSQIVSQIVKPNGWSNQSVSQKFLTNYN